LGSDLTVCRVNVHHRCKPICLRARSGCRQGSGTGIKIIAWAGHCEVQIIDLVVWDGTHEIDVTRLQKLFFTLVATLFVATKVAAQNEVPDIPQGLLLLMGLSNRVYL
jgi:hypothetical protein